MEEVRYVLIGAHLDRADVEVPGVHPIDAGPVVLSSVAFHPGRGIADPELVRQALETRQRLLERATFIAIRYGVSVAGDDEARAKCGAHAARWRAVLEKRKGMVEVTVRITGESRPARPDRKDFTSGAQYLRALYQSRLPRIDPAARERIEQAFQPFAVAQRWIGREDGGSELAVLIRRADLEPVRAASGALRDALKGVPFLVSGPWPLEVFADEEG